jgi:hypothetical protein
MVLEKNLARFIFQSYSDSDLDINGEGCIRCCTEYHKFDLMMVRGSFPFAVTQITDQWDISGMTEPSSGQRIPKMEPREKT